MRRPPRPAGLRGRRQRADRPRRVHATGQAGPRRCPGAGLRCPGEFGRSVHRARGDRRIAGDRLSGVRPALVTVGLLCPSSRRFRGAGCDDWTVHRCPRSRYRAVAGRGHVDPLPLPAIEQLARGLEPVAVPAGHVVFKQGDVGDRYYVIESGEAEVIGDGHVVATLGQGRDSERSRCSGASVGRPPYGPSASSGSRRCAPTTSCGRPGYTPSAREAGTVVETMLDRYTPHDDPEQPPG